MHQIRGQVIDVEVCILAEDAGDAKSGMATPVEPSMLSDIFTGLFGAAAAGTGELAAAASAPYGITYEEATARPGALAKTYSNGTFRPVDLSPDASPRAALAAPPPVEYDNASGDEGGLEIDVDYDVSDGEDTADAISTGSAEDSAEEGVDAAAALLRSDPRIDPAAGADSGYDAPPPVETAPAREPRPDPSPLAIAEADSVRASEAAGRGPRTAVRVSSPNLKELEALLKAESFDERGTNSDLFEVAYPLRFDDDDVRR